MGRSAYDLSHLSHTCGDIGRIQTLSVIPMEAGSSLELSIAGLARLAAARKEIVSDCQVDICVFEVPHRACLGQQWVDFMKYGVKRNGVTTNTIDLAQAVGAAYRNPEYLGLPTCGPTINKLLPMGYNKIFYDYYAIPSMPGSNDHSGTNQDYTWYPTTEPGADRCRKYGRLAARLPHVLVGGTMTDAGGASGWETQQLNPSDEDVPIDVGNGTFKITDLAKVKALYASEAQRAWFEHFYQDVMEKFGGSASKDADPSNLRTTMLMRHTQMMSGHDVDGTDAQTLGTFQGKNLDRVNLHMRRKYFAEHCNVWILALFRYPLVHNREVHETLYKTNWSYTYIAGESELLANEPPIEWDPSPWLAGGSSITPQYYIKQPYGQHMRFQNNRVHPNYQRIPGYPFSNFNGVNSQDMFYYQNNEYKDTFNTTQIGQWQMSALINAKKYSHIPGVSSSIFAGTR